MYIKRFSKIEDEDYYQDSKKIKDRATSNRKVAPWVTGLLGAGLGAATRSGAGVILGAAGGAYLGHKLGKASEKKVHEEEDRKVSRYKKASEKDKAYLRRRAREEELDRQKAEDQRIARHQVHATYHAGRW